MPPIRLAPLSVAFAARPAVQLTSRRTLFGLTGPSPARSRARLWFAVGLLAGGGLIIYAKDSRAGVHRCACSSSLAHRDAHAPRRWLAIPVIHALTVDDPERGHVLAVKMLTTPFAPVDQGIDDEDVLSFEVPHSDYSYVLR